MNVTHNIQYKRHCIKLYKIKQLSYII